MKGIRPAIIVIMITLLSFILLSCGGGVAVVVDITTAKAQFVTWIGNQEEVPDHAVGNYLCTLNAGDVISSENPIEEQSQQRQSDPVNEAGWLFYLDEQPGGFYPHPGRILAISQTGKIMYQEEIQGWPTVNQQTPEIMTKENSTRITQDPGQWTVYNPSRILIPAVVFRYFDVYPIQLRVFGALVTCGLTPTENLYTETMNVSEQMYDALWDLFNCDVGDERVKKRAAPYNQASHIEAAVADLINNKGVTNLTLYFIAHGGYRAVNMGGNIYGCDILETLINEYPNVTFTVIMETCHGGSWTDYFEGLGLTGMPNVNMFISSTTSDKNAYGDWDYAEGIADFNADQDQYIEFTSDFLYQMEHWTKPENWPTIQALPDYGFNGNSIIRLYYYCYKYTKNRWYPGYGPSVDDSYVLTERFPIEIQEPQMYFP